MTEKRYYNIEFEKNRYHSIGTAGFVRRKTQEDGQGSRRFFREPTLAGSPEAMHTPFLRVRPFGGAIVSRQESLCLTQAPGQRITACGCALHARPRGKPKRYPTSKVALVPVFRPTGKAANRDSIKSKVFEGGEVGASRAGRFGEGRRKRGVLPPSSESFLLPSPIFLTSPLQSTS